MARSGELSTSQLDAVEGLRQRLDLRVFAPRPAVRPARWRHSVRRLDCRGRLPLPEAVELSGDIGRSLRATLLPDRWELSPASPQLGAIALDGRLRVRIPAGVRYRLGINGVVVVSLAFDSRRLVVWPASHEDDPLAVELRGGLLVDHTVRQ